MNRRQLALAMGALPASTLLAGLPMPAQAAGADVLMGAIAGTQRSDKNRVRDRYRHPLQTLTFWGLEPGMTVVEVEPGGGYWTEILAPYLRATGGTYIAAIEGDGAAFKARYADPSIWGTLHFADFGAPRPILATAGSADMVITARNLHDWMWTPGKLDDALASFHAALKPAGVLAVEEHRADPRPMVKEARDGYVSTAFLTEAVEKAGFVFDASSEINANPKDTKDHPFGVWTLPPTLQSHEKDQPTPPGYDAAKYVAMGESDRMTLRFRSN